MQNSRRKFIQNASLVLAGASLKPSVLWSKNDTIAKTKNLIGIKLKLGINIYSATALIKY